MWLRYSERKMVELFANIGDPDQTPRSAASDLGLHCLPVTFLGVSRLRWVKASALPYWHNTRIVTVLLFPYRSAMKAIISQSIYIHVEKTE